ncbi:MAG: hypothetical protein DLM63_06025 [Solirubrobacterales bacterium]|nr:MAG: hypothetical protein DLM63_06025 [Solirubrobacterales bacterium]
MRGVRRSTSTTPPSHLRPKGSTSRPRSGSSAQACGNQQQKHRTGSTTPISHSCWSPPQASSNATTRSSKHDPSSITTAPNATIERWLPHAALTERAACVVCHGGMGITQRALAAGTPVCVVPFGRDQFEAASRVTATRSGTQVMPDALTPETLRAAIKQAMTLRPGAQQVASGFRRAGGAPAAANALETLLAREGRPTTPSIGAVPASQESVASR